jgi:hypothetical protein
MHYNLTVHAVDLNLTKHEHGGKPCHKVLSDGVGDDGHYQMKWDMNV